MDLDTYSGIFRLFGDTLKAYSLPDRPRCPHKSRSRRATRCDTRVCRHSSILDVVYNKADQTTGDRSHSESLHRSPTSKRLSIPIPQSLFPPNRSHRSSSLPSSPCPLIIWMVMLTTADSSSHQTTHSRLQIPRSANHPRPTGWNQRR